MSGCRESPPAIASVGVRRVELRLYPPHGHVLPLYYTPAQAVAGRELGSHAPHACILPLYYIPQSAPQGRKISNFKH